MYGRVLKEWATVACAIRYSYCHVNRGTYLKAYSSLQLFRTEFCAKLLVNRRKHLIKKKKENNTNIRT